jgi:hypothetical protein
MSYTFNEQEHKDFELDKNNLVQKLKGDVSFFVSDMEVPLVDMEIDPKRKKTIAYKIREKIINVKGTTRKLF